LIDESGLSALNFLIASFSSSFEGFVAAVAACWPEFSAPFVAIVFAVARDDGPDDFAARLEKWRDISGGAIFSA
jgi:hypothetical protein